MFSKGFSFFRAIQSVLREGPREALKYLLIFFIISFITFLTAGYSEFSSNLIAGIIAGIISGTLSGVLVAFITKKLRLAQTSQPPQPKLRKIKAKPWWQFRK
jgi:hypothetical protein